MLHSNIDIIKHPGFTLVFFHFRNDTYGVGLEMYSAGEDHSFWGLWDILAWEGSVQSCK